MTERTKLYCKLCGTLLGLAEFQCGQPEIIEIFCNDDHRNEHTENQASALVRTKASLVDLLDAGDIDEEQLRGILGILKGGEQ